MIGEIDIGLVEAVTSPKRVGIEDVERVAHAQFLHHIGHARQTFLAQQPKGLLLQPQPSTQGIGLKFEVIARRADHVDISAPDAGNGQTFVDGGDRQFLFGANARALLACQPFERNGGQQLIIAKQASRRVVRRVVDAEQIHWGCRIGGWNGKLTAASTAPRGAYACGYIKIQVPGRSKSITAISKFESYYAECRAVGTRSLSSGRPNGSGLWPARHAYWSHGSESGGRAGLATGLAAALGGGRAFSVDRAGLGFTAGATAAGAAVAGARTIGFRSGGRCCVCRRDRPRGRRRERGHSIHRCDHRFRCGGRCGDCGYWRPWRYRCGRKRSVPRRRCRFRSDSRSDGYRFRRTCARISARRWACRPNRRCPDGRPRPR